MMVVICLDPDGFLAPGIFFPLMADVGLCFLVSFLSKRAIWRFLASAIIPVVVALSFGIYFSDSSGEAGGWAFLAAIYLLVAGAVAGGLAGILGYFTNLARMSKMSSYARSSIL